MPSLTLNFNSDDGQTDITVTREVGECWHDYLPVFQDFLCGIGFYVRDGELDFVPFPEIKRID